MPHQGECSKINFQDIPRLQQKFLTSNDFKLLKLSLTSKRGIPRRAINRRNANITLALFTQNNTNKNTCTITLPRAITKPVYLYSAFFTT